MSDINPEPAPVPKEMPERSGAQAAQPTSSGSQSGDRVAIAAIAGVAIVALCCIVSCAVVAFAFINNAPW